MVRVWVEKIGVGDATVRSVLNEFWIRLQGWIPPGIRSGLLVLIAACIVLLPGLGTSGLWDPWEMRSAKVARTMMEPARVLVVELPQAQDKDSKEAASERSSLSSAITEEWGESLSVWGASRVMPERALNSSKTTMVSALKHFRKARDSRVYHAFILDGDAFVKNLDDLEGLEKLGRELDSIVTSHDGALVAVGSTRFKDDLDTFREAVQRAWVGIHLAAVAHWFPDEVPEEDEELEKLADELVSDYAEIETLRVFGGYGDLDGLRDALEDVESLPSQRAQFIRDGAVRSIPVFDPWMVSLSYSIFGVSEWSSRLPFALLGVFGVFLIFLLGRFLYSERIGLLAAFVLLTMPLHFASARIVGSEISSSVFLLAGFGLLAGFITNRFSLRWIGVLVLIALGLFFSKGLYGVMLLLLIAAGYLLVSLDRRRTTWIPILVLLGVFGVLVGLVFLPGEWTFFSHFRFMRRLFSHGPLELHRTFDHFIRQLGFGLFPWSVLLPFAFGALVVRAMRGEGDSESEDKWDDTQRLHLLVFLYFVIPLVVMMVTLKDFSQLIYPAAPAAAFAVAVFLDRMMKEERLGAVAAFAVGFMLLIFFREVKDSAEPLVEFMSTDPPWLHEERIPSQYKALVKGTPVFPDAFQLGWLYLGAVAMGLFVLVAHFGRVMTSILRIARYFQRPIPLAVAMTVGVAGLGLRLVGGLKGRLTEALLLPSSAPLTKADRLFTPQLFNRPEHVLIMVLVGLLIVVTVLSCTAWGRGVWEKTGGRFLRLLPDALDRFSRHLFLVAILSASSLIGFLLWHVLGASHVVWRLLFSEPGVWILGLGVQWHLVFSDPGVWVLGLGVLLSIVSWATHTHVEGLRPESATGRFVGLFGESWKRTLVFFIAFVLFVASRLVHETGAASWLLWAHLFPLAFLSSIVLMRQFRGRLVPLALSLGALVVVLIPSLLGPVSRQWIADGAMALSASQVLAIRQTLMQPEFVLGMLLMGISLVFLVFSATQWGRWLWNRSVGWVQAWIAANGYRDTLLAVSAISALALTAFFLFTVYRPARFGWGTTFSDPAVWILGVAVVASLLSRLAHGGLQTLPAESIVKRVGQRLGGSWRVSITFSVALVLYTVVRLTKEVWVAPWWLWVFLVPLALLSAVVLIRQYRGRSAPLLRWAVSGMVALALTVLFLFTVDRPAGFGWGTTFSDPAVWILGVAVVASLLSRLAHGGLQTLPAESIVKRVGLWLGGSWRVSITFSVALVLYVVIRLTKEVWVAPWWLWVFLVPLALLSAVVLIVQYRGRSVPLLWWAVAGMAVLIPSILVPLVYKWRVIEPIVFPGGGDDTLRYLFVGSRTTWGLYALVVGLSINAVWAFRKELLSRVASNRASHEGIFFGVAILCAGLAFALMSPHGSSARLVGFGLIAAGGVVVTMGVAFVWRVLLARVLSFLQRTGPVLGLAVALACGLVVRLYLLREGGSSGKAIAMDPIFAGCLVTLALLGINYVRRFADIEGVLVFLERGRVAAFLFLICASICSLAFIHQLIPGLSLHVSQKHLVDTYANANESVYARGPLLKYGKLFKGGDEYNFYTHDIPAVSDKGKALDVLAHSKDVMVKLTGVRAGRVEDHMIVPGWDDRNDPDGDGVRNWAADNGVADKVELGTLTDQQQSWKTNRWAGHLLVDSAGSTFPIASNTSTTLVLQKDAGEAEQLKRGRLVDQDKSWASNQWTGFQLIDGKGKAHAITSNTKDALVFQGLFPSSASAGSVTPYRIEGRPRFGGPSSYTSRYGIDHPDAPAHEATGMNRDRTFVMLPQEGLSSLNHEFRKRAKGRHIAILDDRSSRILLATSRLVKGEKNHNWVAHHTLTKKAFKKVKGIRPGRVHFGDRIVYRGFKMEKDTIKAGEKMKMTLYYEVLKDLKVNYKVFMHIERSGNRINGDHFVLNKAKDGKQEKCNGCYQSKHWRKGDIIVDVYEKEIATGTPAGPQDVWMGIFNSANDKRLEVGEFDKKRIRHDGSNRVLIGTFNVR